MNGGHLRIRQVAFSFSRLSGGDLVKAVISGKDAFLHTLVVGPTGSGKTSKILKPMAEQVLEAMDRGVRCGLTIVEPDDGFINDVRDWARELDIPYIYINPLDPNTDKFNPLEGDKEIAAEATKTVLTRMFGKQDPFFSMVQQVTARNAVLLLKEWAELRGGTIDLVDLVRTLRDMKYLQRIVEEVQAQVGESDLVQFFRLEVLGKGKDKFYEHVLGLRAQLEDLTGNIFLRRVFTGKSDIQFDQFMENGGVCLVSTAMGHLGKLGDAFGQFFLMHYQGAVFRRPGTEWTRIPQYLIVDEAPRYINESFEQILAIGRKFRVATVLAIQSLGQLEDVERGFAETVLTNTRNKIVFGGLSEADAKRFEREFGMEPRKKISKVYEHSLLTGKELFPESYREDERDEPRFKYTEIMELPADYFICKVVKDGSPQRPVVAKGLLAKRAQLQQPTQVRTPETKTAGAAAAVTAGTVGTAMPTAASKGQEHAGEVRDPETHETGVRAEDAPTSQPDGDHDHQPASPVVPPQEQTNDHPFDSNEPAANTEAQTEATTQVKGNSFWS